MSILDMIFLPFEISCIVVWFRSLVRLVREARASSTVAPWPIRVSCVLLGAAAVSWVVSSLALATRNLDAQVGVEAVMHGILSLVFVSLLTISLFHGGRASYWVLVALVIPAFLLVSGMLMLFVGRELFLGGWLAVVAWLGWVSCAASLALLILPQSFRYFRAAYLVAMASKKLNESGVG